MEPTYTFRFDGDLAFLSPVSTYAAAAQARTDAASLGFKVGPIYEVDTAGNWTLAEVR